MKIALASMPVKNRDIDFNLNVILDTVKTYAGKADLLLFGEAVLQGFDCLCWDYVADNRMAVALTDAPIQKLRSAARESRIALSFGMIERGDEALYSSQVFIGTDGEIVNVFHRVSRGWKDYTQTDDHYREGTCFKTFSYGGRTFATGLCGDLWTENRPEEMKALNADVVLWPIWRDCDPGDWNTSIKHEYAEQAALCGKNVLLVNPFCADADAEGWASGGSACFRDGKILAECAAGTPAVLIVEC